MKMKTIGINSSLFSFTYSLNNCYLCGFRVHWDKGQGETFYLWKTISPNRHLYGSRFYSVTYPLSISVHYGNYKQITETYSKTCQTFKKDRFAKIVNGYYFCKAPHLRCLIRIWIRKNLLGTRNLSLSEKSESQLSWTRNLKNFNI